MGRRAKYHLDHVHLLVTDREAAASWYERCFGFERVEVSEDPYGPLTVSGDGGTTGLALFTSKVPAEPNRVVAFRVDAVEFQNFATRLTALELKNAEGRTLAITDVVDHGDVLSFYFVDLDGNPVELATYDVEIARQGLRERIAELLMRP